VYIGGMNENDPTAAAIARNYTYHWNEKNEFIGGGYDIKYVAHPLLL
jgi:hypothetical protein